MNQLNREISVKGSPRPARSIAHRIIEGEALIITIDDSMQHVLDEVGTFIWSLLSEGELTVEELADAVSARYQVDAGQARTDVARFIEELQVRGIVEPGGA